MCFGSHFIDRQVLPRLPYNLQIRVKRKKKLIILADQLYAVERDKFFFLSLSHVVIVGRVIEELALHCACSFFPLFKRDLRFLNVVACCTRRHTGRQKWHKTFYYFQKNGKAFFPVAKNVTVGAYTGRQAGNRSYSFVGMFIHSPSVHSKALTLSLLEIK